MVQPARLRLWFLAVTLLLSGVAGLALTAAWPDLSAFFADQDLFFEQPQWLWLLAALPYLWIVPIYSLTDLPVGQRVASALIRSALLVSAAVALANPQSRFHEPRPVAVVVLADVSASTTDAFAVRAQQSIDRLWQARGTNRLHVIRFAGKAAVVEPDRQLPARPPQIERLADSGEQTDLQDALRLAYGLFGPDEIKRILVITDGHETVGTAAAESAAAERFGIEISYLDQSDLPVPAEFMVQGLDTPADIKARIPFDAVGRVYANQAGRVTCQLDHDGKTLEKTTVALAAGANTVPLHVRLEQRGQQKLQFLCRPADPDSAGSAEPIPPAADRMAANNRFETVVAVADRPHLLYIEGERAYQSNLLAALQDDFEVEVRGAAGIPAAAEDLEQFDLLFISDVPREAPGHGENFSYAQMRLVDKWVLSGGGLIVAGGPESLGPGGYGDTYLEREVLPVRLQVEKREDETGLALVLAIDRSGSMSGQKIELAKQAAKATAEMLGRSDRIGIVAFDAQALRIVRLQPATNRLRIIDNIERLRAGGGTNIYPALEMAFADLAEVEAQVKHLILLSDGQSPREGIEDIVQAMNNDRITISTIGVGSSVDRSLLSTIAELGGGRFYFTDRADNIPKIFMKETSEVTRQAVVEDRFQAVMNPRFRNAQVFRGIEWRRVPPLLGYVSTQAKPAAEVLLSTHLSEPLLARWRHGLGQVVVWTSDVKNRWSHEWLRWPSYAQFWRQLIRDTCRVEHQTVIALHAEVRHGQLHAWADAVGPDDQFQQELQASVRLTDPEGHERRLALEQTAPGRYEVRLPLQRFGPYALQAEFRSQNDAPGAAPLATGQAFTAYPYPDEDLRLGHDLTSVRMLANATHGSANPPAAVLFDPRGAQVERSQSQRFAFLVAALVLFLLDVFLRRVRLWGAGEIPFKPRRTD